MAPRPIYVNLPPQLDQSMLERCAKPFAEPRSPNVGAPTGKPDAPNEFPKMLFEQNPYEYESGPSEVLRKVSA